MANRLWSCATVLFVLFEVIGVSTETKPVHRACVIGAGFAGLATARYLKEYGVNFTVFEASRYVGGTWRFDPHVGTDEDGLPLFTSMYKNLRTNTPIQTMEFSGFPFPEGSPSYPNGTCYYKYLQLFTKHFQLMDNIQTRSYVQLIKWAGDLWNVTYMKTDTRNNITEQCDFVVIASGQYSAPLWPKFEGQKLFEGNMMHSHDYKEPETFRNRRVLVIGAGPSGLDLATHLSNVTAKLVHSHHLQYNEPYFSDNYIRKPDIKTFTSNGVIFQDDSYEEVDDVILCTGYDFNIPFLDQNCGVTATGKFVLPLYQQTVNIRHPTMTFIGNSKRIINRVLDAQGQYSAALAAGKFKLPDQEAMLKSWLDHVYSIQRKGMKITDVNVIGNAMDDYFTILNAEAGVVRAPPVLAEIRDFNAKNRLEDLLNYRDYDYKILGENRYARRYNLREGSPCLIDLEDS